MTAQTILNRARNTIYRGGILELAKTQQKHIDRLTEVGEGRYTVVKPTAAGKHPKYMLRCVHDGHEWENSYSHLVNRNQGCPKCAGNVLTNEERIENIADVANGRYVVTGIMPVIDDRDQSFSFKCNTCDHEWVTTYGSVYRQKTGCPSCTNRIKLTPETRMQRMVDVLGDAVEVICLVLENGARSRYRFRCLVDGHEWETTYTKIVHGGTGCAKCQKRAAGAKFMISPEDRVRRINEVGSGRFVCMDLVQEAGSHSKYRYKCLVDGHEWVTTHDAIVNGGKGCPVCHGMGYSSTIAGSFYIVRWTHTDGRTFYKFGITNKTVKKRVNDQRKQTEFIPEIVYEATYDTGDVALMIENKIKSRFECGVIDKESFPDGYTETIGIDMFDDVMCVVMTK